MFPVERSGCAIIETEAGLDHQAAYYIQRYSDLVLRLALSCTGNRSDAEDVCQEVFVQLLRKQPHFREPDHEKAWIIRVTIHRSRDLLRTFRRRQTVPLEESIPAITNADNREVVEAVLALPKKYRLIIHLHYFEGYRTREIAELLSVRESTVRSQLMRARARLKTILEGCTDERNK
ncbi:sigma-70 family RNA polymerase sigma factor [Gorillibacterium sp. CAU 1737]|uniref:RNA polymerase sigma factor n=1 Tax=Gorillibacterium sp. CAU 1737 TaxID=3140362 RepID=UPI0032605D1C